MPRMTASTTTSTEVLADGDGAKRNVILSNSDANICYVLLGTGTASASNFSFILAQNTDAFLDGYDGPAQAVWAADGTGYLAADSYQKN